MALSQNTARRFSPAGPDDFQRIPMDAAAKLYQGSAVGEDSGNGYCRAHALGDRFLGFCEHNGFDNTSGANAAIEAEIRVRGVVFDLPVTGVTVGTTRIGAPVYAVDDGTFNTSSNAGTRTAIGVIARVSAADTADVHFVGAGARQVSSVIDLTT